MFATSRISKAGSVRVAAPLAALVLTACAARQAPAPVDIPQLPNQERMFSGAQGSGPPEPLPEPTAAALDISMEGDAVTCELFNAPLEKVLSRLDALTPLQFVFQGRLRGRVTAKFESVALEQALEMLLAAGSYEFERKGEILVIGRDSEGEGEGNVTVQEVYLASADARQVIEQLRATFEDQEYRAGFGLLPGAAGLYVVATPEQMDDVMDVIAIIDRPVRQVMIETLFVEVGEEDFVELGLGLTRLSGGRLADFSFAPGSAVFPALAMTLDATGEASRTLFSSITALAEQGSAAIMSRPYAVARSGERTEMRAEEIVNVTAERTVSGNSVSTFEEIRAGTIMIVEPTINPDDSITLQLELEHSQFLSLSTVGDVDIRRTFEKARTIINVKSGETVVLGGFIQRRDISGSTSVPFLDRIPFIRHLFSRRTTQVEEAETVFVLTPHLLPLNFEEFRGRQPPRVGDPVD